MAGRSHVMIPLLLVSLVLVTPLVGALTVNVAANAEECFMEEVRRGEKVLGSFNVAKGGQLDIDIKVKCELVSCGLCWRRIECGTKWSGVHTLLPWFLIALTLQVYNPDNSIVYEQDRMIEDSFSFVALQTGVVSRVLIDSLSVDVCTAHHTGAGDLVRFAQDLLRQHYVNRHCQSSVVLPLCRQFTHLTWCSSLR